MTAAPQQADLLASGEPTAEVSFRRPVDLFGAELWLVGRLKQHGVHGIFDGDTDPPLRRERFRQAILDHGLERVMACQQDNERVAATYGETFESMYHTPLQPDAKPAKRKARSAAPTAASQTPAGPSHEDPDVATAASLDDNDIAF